MYKKEIIDKAEELLRANDPGKCNPAFHDSLIKSVAELLRLVYAQEQQLTKLEYCRTYWKDIDFQ